MLLAPSFQTFPNSLKKPASPTAVEALGRRGLIRIMSQTVYRIAKWNETFETADSRRHKKLAWVSLPINLQSNGYQSLIDQHPDDAPALYGAWCALVAIAAQCPERGVLATSRGEPITPERCARMTYMPVEPFCKLFEWASSPGVRWLEALPTKNRSIDGQPIDDQPSIDGEPVSDRSSIELPNLTIQNQTPPSPQAPLTEAVGEGDWESLEKELNRSGVLLARAAIDGAIKNSCSPDQVQNHLEYWRRHQQLWRSPEGVLYTRITNLKPEHLPDRAWPAFDPELVQRAEYEHERERKAREHAQRHAERQKRRAAG